MTEMYYVIEGRNQLFYGTPEECKQFIARENITLGLTHMLVSEYCYDPRPSCTCEVPGDVERRLDYDTPVEYSTSIALFHEDEEPLIEVLVIE